MSRRALPPAQGIPVQGWDPGPGLPKGDPGAGPSTEIQSSTSTPTPTVSESSPSSAEMGANLTGSPASQARRPRKKSFREVHRQLMTTFSSVLDDADIDGPATTKAEVIDILYQDAHRLIDQLEAELQTGVPTSVLGSKLSGGKRRTEKRFQTKFRSQLELARAFLDERDITLSLRLLTCKIAFPEFHFRTKSLLYIDKANTLPAESEYSCLVRGCFFCGGDVSSVKDAVNALAAVLDSVPLSELDHFTFCLGTEGGPSIDGIYDAVASGIAAVAASEAWGEGFSGTVRDIELFNDEHEPWGHVHVVVRWKTDDAEARASILKRVASTWAKNTNGVGWVHDERIRDIGRTLRYGRKGYCPHTKPNPHLGVSLEHMRGIARLTIRGVYYHYATGSFAPSAVMPGKPTRKRKPKAKPEPRLLSSSSDSVAKPVPENKSGKAKRHELHTARAAVARAARRARPNPTRSRYDAAGVVSIEEVVLRSGFDTSRPSPIVAGLQPTLSALLPEEERHAVLDVVIRGSGQVALGASAGSGKTTIISDAIHARPRLPTLAVAFNRSTAATLTTRLADLERAVALTLHQVGYRGWAEFIGRNPVIDEYKLHRIVTRLVGDPSTGFGLEVLGHVQRAKALLVRPDDLALLGPLSATTLGGVKDVLAASLRDESTLDHDDLIYMTLVADAPLPRYEFICVDEVQDLSPALVEIVVQLVGVNQGFFVGDRWQSINLFRNADADALTSLVKRHGAREFVLTYSRRCPEGVARIAREYVPTFRAMPGRDEGFVDELEGYLDNLDWFQPGMLILARTKPALRRLAKALTEHGVQVNVMFHDDGDPFVGNRNAQPPKLRRDAVNLSTIHSAKGLEAHHVGVIVEPPSKGGALTHDEHQQELNTHYVAVTRSMDSLTFLANKRKDHEE
jgi:hypothetical protein